MSSAIRSENAPQHAHEFYLTHSFVGRESGATFYVGTCSCGATETVLPR